jgi:hypothetical protein
VTSTDTSTTTDLEVAELRRELQLKSEHVEILLKSLSETRRSLSRLRVRYPRGVLLSGIAGVLLVGSIEFMRWAVLHLGLPRWGSILLAVLVAQLYGWLLHRAFRTDP